MVRPPQRHVHAACSLRNAWQSDPHDGASTSFIRDGRPCAGHPRPVLRRIRPRSPWFHHAAQLVMSAPDHALVDIQVTREADVSRPNSMQFARFLFIRVAALCALTVIMSPYASARELPLHAIINGHTVQPHESQLQALGHPDLTPRQQQEVDQLYLQILRASRSDSTA